MNGPQNNLDATEVSPREEAREILSGFRSALASLSVRERADIATRSPEENVGQRKPTGSD